DFFTQFVVIAKDIAARERLRTKLERVLQEDFPGAVTRTVPLELGPPVGWPVQYRVSGPDVNEVRDIALRLAQIVASHARAAGQFRLDRAGPKGSNPHRSGPGTPLRLELGIHRGSTQQGDVGLGRYPGAGQHLSGRCPHAGNRRAARFSVDAAQPAV